MRFELPPGSALTRSRVEEMHHCAGHGPVERNVVLEPCGTVVSCEEAPPEVSAWTLTERRSLPADRRKSPRWDVSRKVLCLGLRRNASCSLAASPGRWAPRKTIAGLVATTAP